MFAGAFKRATNIVRQAKTNLMGSDGTIFPEEAVLKEEAEQMLWKAIQNAIERTGQASGYPSKLKEMIPLRAPLDHFFDKVMVMDEDPKIKMNRLSPVGPNHDTLPHRGRFFQASKCIRHEGSLVDPGQYCASDLRGRHVFRARALRFPYRSMRTLVTGEKTYKGAAWGFAFFGVYLVTRPLQILLGPAPHAAGDQLHTGVLHDGAVCASGLCGHDESLFSVPTTSSKARFRDLCPGVCARPFFLSP